MKKRYLEMYVTSIAIGFAISTAVVHAEVGVSDKEIKIGTAINLSGSNFRRPTAYISGSELYFKHLNEKGGIHGRKVTLVKFDDKYDPKLTLEGTKKLISEDKVFTLFNYYGTPTVRAAMPLIEKENIPLVACMSGALFLRKPVNKNFYNFRVGYEDEAKRMIRFVLEKKLTNVAIFYQDDSFGDETRAPTVMGLQEISLKPLIQSSYPRGTTDVAKAVKAISDSNPDVVLLWGLTDPTIEFLKQYKNTKSKPIFITHSANGTPEFAKAVVDAKIDAQIYVTLAMPPPQKSGTKMAKDFIAASAAASTPTDAGRFEGWASAAMLSYAMEKAGKDLTRDNLRRAFESMTDVDLDGFKISLNSESHQALREPMFYHFKNGELTPVE